MNWSNSKVLNELMTKIQSMEIPSPEYKPEFRASSLPFCPLLHIKDVKKYNNDNMGSKEYSSSFYTSIGTTIHTILQDFAKHSHPESFIGNWKCNRVLSSEEKGNTRVVSTCSTRKEWGNFNSCVDVVCPHGKEDCHKNFGYEEINFDYKGLAGHLDFLFLHEEKYYILDFKTTSSWLFDEPKKALKSGYYPSKKYIEQIETYGYLLKKQYGIDVYGYAIVYLSRESPTDKKKLRHAIFARKFDLSTSNKRGKRVVKSIARYEAAMKYLSKENKENMDFVYALRPCKNEADYQREMKHKFFGKENCPFQEDKTCFSGKIKKYLKNLK